MKIKNPRHLERFSFTAKKKCQGISDITVFSVHIETVLRFSIVYIFSKLKTSLVVLPRHLDKAREKEQREIQPMMVIIISTSLVSQTRWTFYSDKNLESVSRNFLLIITFASNFEDSFIMTLACISVPVRKFFFEENFPSEKFKLKICFISHNCLSEHNLFLITVYLNTT